MFAVRKLSWAEDLLWYDDRGFVSRVRKFIVALGCDEGVSSEEGRVVLYC